ncbi:methyltransferase domain-containing protein [Pseudomonas sp. CDFA 553]|uniref:class I SAM-dependent methyltransferase n=1 Tax=Pseudomonas quasicaspiana TaxID=2829821 RepID=UPI001E35F024|nr:class I SAM-dependent methyltransferase [Pseudomonas quasicaspiana]MCD5989347.1 methyltransferase domain-containing protein [Pseudomonas quasicaspiana]
MDLKETDILGAEIGHHWYYNSKVKAMDKFLGDLAVNRVLDVGAGSGFFSRHLLENTSASEAWCVDISYEADADESVAGKPIYLRRSCGPLEADLVLLMDVLEHVDDDIGLLKEYVDKVPLGSRFLMTVPAFQFLWSGHDDFLDHKRRYTLPQLESVAAAAGLKVSKGAYYFGGVFPIAALLRIIERLKRRKQHAASQLAKHGPLVNGALKAICSAELPFMGVNRLAGLTVFCIAEKIK